MDSRTAAFDRKRRLDEDESRDNDGSPKRLKLDPSAGGSGIAPSVSWNSGTKSKIRTSLGGGRNTATPLHDVAPVLPNPSSPQVAQSIADSDVELSRSDESGEENGIISNLEDLDKDHSESQKTMASNVIDLDSEPGSIPVVPDAIDSLDEGEVQDLSDSELGKGSASQHVVEAQQTDALMRYSDSRPSEADYHDNRQDETAPISPEPKVLADLTISQLRDQHRYFYITKDFNAINLLDPVRCLVCAEEGHTLSSCPSLTCASCHLVHDHFTRNCPQTRKCLKCRNQGHDWQSCPYKLARPNHAELTCDLCQRTGHIEDKCELLWRTSGRPWESNLHSFPSLVLSCYECGAMGHLGNDCPTRNPRKHKGSSTWSGSNIPRIAGSGIAIKGRAQQPATLDYGSEDDRSSFIRPRIPPPSRQGQIQIVGRGNNFTPINENQSSTVRKKQSDRLERRNPSMGSDPRRSVPEPVRGNPRGRESLDDRYQPQYASQQPALLPRQKGMKAPQGGSGYRPMPSAAQGAWKKYRS